jgi:thiol:disulfide interchange protein DsbC
MKKVIEKRKDIAFFIKMFPLPMHKGADEKAKAIVCEKSMTLLEDSFANKDIPPAKCTTTVIDDDLKLGAKLGIQGTPAIIFPDGRMVQGYMEADRMISTLEKK